jgi:alpha-beta hydrolase superfamily lysophospholipase
LRGAEFSVFDKDGNGFFNVDEMRLLTQPYLDALKEENFALLDQWAATSAAVATPKGWFKDHFAQGAIWSYLSQLDCPVACFQGDLDTSVPIEGVRFMEAKAKAAGKSKMEFHYFAGFGHSLGIERYFYDGTVTPGHKAMFEFLGHV